MSIYNLRPYIGIAPLIGGYNLGPYLITPLWKQLNAIAYWNFGDGSKIIPGDTATDIEGWKDTATTPIAYDIEQTTEANQPTWVQGYSTTGAELVTNGDFSDGLTGWTTSNASVVGGVLTFTGSGFIYQNLNSFGLDTLFTSAEGTASQFPQLSKGIDTNNGGSSDSARIQVNGTIGETVDNISVKLAAEDASKSHALFSSADEYLSTGVTQIGDTTLYCDPSQPYTVIGHTDIPVNGTGYLGPTKANSSVASRIFGLYANVGNLDVFINGGGNTGFAGIDPSGKHTHAVTWDGVTCKLYWDGEFAGNLTVGPEADTTDIILIGQRLNGSAATSFEGKMLDGIQIYGSALSASEIKAVTAELN